MESEGGFNSQQMYNDARVPRSGMEGQVGSMRKPDEYMPIANIIRIMRRILPANAKVADDAKETVQECLTEFISYITSEANARCHRDCRKTVTPEDVLSAMAALGFHDYIQPLTIFLNNHRAQDPLRSAPPTTYLHQPPHMVRPFFPAPGSGASSAAPQFRH